MPDPGFDGKVFSHEWTRMSQRILCETCRKVREQERYNATPREKRDGKVMLYSEAIIQSAKTYRTMSSG